MKRIKRVECERHSGWNISDGDKLKSEDSMVDEREDNMDGDAGGGLGDTGHVDGKVY